MSHLERNIMKRIKENDYMYAYLKIGIDSYRLSSHEPLVEDIGDGEEFSECERSKHKKVKQGKAGTFVERLSKVPCGDSDNVRHHVSGSPLVRVQNRVTRRPALKSSGYKRSRNKCKSKQRTKSSRVPKQSAARCIR